MTTLIFRTDHGRITGFTVRGHSGYADAGEDIVCAAITSAVRLTETAINDVMGLCAPVRMNEDEPPSVTLRLPGGLSGNNEETCQILLTGFMVHAAQLRDEYPDFLTVLEDDSSSS